MFKFLIAFVVFVAAVGALWWTGLLTKWVPTIPTPQSMITPKQAAVEAQQPATTTPQTPEPPAPTYDLPTSASDATDEAIVKDSAAIDAQITTLAGENTDAQNTLTDKPITQEY